MTPSMSTRDEINLRVLQQQDKSIAYILSQTTFVVLYRYSLAEASWSKLPYEGTLFVFERSDGVCGYTILNRLSLERFSKTLESEESVMETEGYVIHKDGDDIWGLWIWDEPNRTEVFQAMQQAAFKTQTRTKIMYNASRSLDLGALFDSVTTVQS